LRRRSGSRGGRPQHAILFVCLPFLAPAPWSRAQETESAQAESVVLPRGSRDWLLVREALDRGLEFLGGRQVSGAVGSRYPVAVTSLSGLAALAAGYQPLEKGYGLMLGSTLRHEKQNGVLLGEALRYLESMENGGYICEPGENQSRMHGHCYAVLFLTQIAGCLPPEEEAKVNALVKRGIQTIENAQSREGGWYYSWENSKNDDEASVTVCALQALRSAHNAGFTVDSLKVNEAIRYVKRCQLPSGSFCYSLKVDREKTTYALTVAALSTLNAAGVYESRELRLGLDWVAKTLDEFPRSPWKAAEKEFEYYANFYAAQTFYQQGGATWVSWYPAVRDYLLKKQRPDGSWECGQYGDEYATATALLILEVPLGYLPIFQR
jgi:prenyltransferase beta subunit